jgi:hypothetical protein
MNKNRLLLLADMIENSTPPAAQPDLHFNLGSYYALVADFDFEHPEHPSSHTCGAIACIAGWACFVFDPETNNHNWGNIPGQARHLLDLDRHMATLLFTPPHVADFELVENWEAAAVLRNLVATGEVDWEAVLGADRMCFVTE